MFTLPFFRIVLPLLATLAGLACLVLTMVGGLKRHSFLDKTYMFEIDVSTIVPYEKPSTTLLSGTTVANSVGLSNHYYFYMWNFCEADTPLKIKRCSDPKIWYYFDPIDILQKQLGTGVRVKLPRDTKSFVRNVRVTSLVLEISSAVGVVAITLLLVFKTVSAVFDLGDSACRFAAAVATTDVLLTSIGVTGLILWIKDMVKKKAGYLKVYVTLGKMTLIFSWVSTYLIIVALISLLVAQRLIQKRRAATEKLY